MHAAHTGQTPEPHARNRRALLARHPEIARLFGYDRRTAALTAAAVAAQFALAAGLQWLGRRAPAPLTVAALLLVAYTAGAVLNHWGGVVIHESSHNLCARTSMGNRWVALLANLPIVVPSAMSFRRYHHDHHRYLGVRGLDNDLATDFEVRWLGRSAPAKLAWLCLYPLFGTLARGFVRWPQPWEIVGVALQLAVDAAVYRLVGPVAFAYLALSTYFAYGPHPIAGHFVHEHYLWSPGQETYSYYGPLNRVTLNMGYHNEHHDFPGVPGARLPELHAIAREHYGALASHESWAKVLWTFLRDPRIGHDARVYRGLDEGAPVRSVRPGATPVRAAGGVAR